MFNLNQLLYLKYSDIAILIHDNQTVGMATDFNFGIVVERAVLPCISEKVDCQF